MTTLLDAARLLRRELDAGMMLPAPVHAALVALVDHHDPADAHEARTGRSEDVTVEVPLKDERPGR